MFSGSVFQMEEAAVGKDRLLSADSGESDRRHDQTIAYAQWAIFSM